MSRIQSRRAEKSVHQSDTVLTPKLMLETYLPAETLLNFIDTARTEDVQENEALINLMNEGLKISIPRQVRKDRGGQEYKYVNFLRPNGPEGVKVSLIGKLNQFLNDYRDKKFVIDFNLEQLVTEAEKA